MKLGINANNDNKLAECNSYAIEFYGPRKSDWQSAAEGVDLPLVGKKYMTWVSEDAIAGTSAINWSADSDDIEKGITGNLGTGRAKIGWRGTSNDVAVYGTGVRDCTKAEKITLKTVVHVVIEFGPMID